jgi:crotonobetaine/carnitine-CoA ligase
MSEFASDERTVVHVLRRAVVEHPGRPWIVNDDASFTYAEMDQLSNRVANGMTANGMAAGDTVTFMLSDVPEFVATWIACSKTGIVEVPVNTGYRGDILVHVVNDSRARSMVVESQFLERLDAVADRLLHLERCFVLTPPGEEVPVPERLAGKCRLVPFAELISPDSSTPGHVPAISDLKAIMYTSGTTGPSKGVMVSQAHAFEYAFGANGVLEIGPDDTYYTAGLPMFHIAGKWGVVYAVAIRGARAAFPRRFSATQFWDDIRKYRATTTFLLGAMANFLQRQPPAADDIDNPLAKVLMCPLLPDLDGFAERFGVGIATAYGSTEVNAPIFMPPGTPVSDIQVVGPVRTDKFEVAVLDENDNLVAPGVLGEIAVRPKEPWITMLGYWNQPEWTVLMWRNQWLHSGDAGRYDTDGNFYFVDRIKDAIRRRGENISSMEVEGVISQHPAIAECAVFPVASEYSEQEVGAAIALKPGETLKPEDLVTFLEPRMAHFMVPRFVVFEAELPKTPTGKIQKYALRERGVTEDTWDREAANAAP